jgi:hypothetical protein
MCSDGFVVAIIIVITDNKILTKIHLISLFFGLNPKQTKSKN